MPKWLALREIVMGKRELPDILPQNRRIYSSKKSK